MCPESGFSGLRDVGDSAAKRSGSHGIRKLASRHKAEVAEPMHDTFYATRELIISDVNRFWITFGQPLSDG